MPGPLPKVASQRRRRNKPKSYGEAEAVKVASQLVKKPPLSLPFDDPEEKPHKLVSSFWNSLGKSAVDTSSWTAAEWQRARISMWMLDGHLKGRRAMGAQAMDSIMKQLDSLLISPAEKRRLGIEIVAHEAELPPEVAIMADYRDRAKKAVS